MHAQGQFSRRLRSFSLAFGPQHPAAHGILRFNCLLQGETIRHLDSLFGFLHRGSEKLMEQRTCLQSLPYFDRFDYVANFQQEHAFCLAVEALSVPRLFLEGPSLALRVLFDEVGRVLNHLLTLSATALDMGVMGPIFWAFEEREVLMSLLEQASGARMHTSLYRPFGLDLSGISALFFRELALFLTRAVRSLGGAFCGLLTNRTLRVRLSLVGQLSQTRVAAYGLTGLIARSAGVFVDGRVQPDLSYALYPTLCLRSYLGRRGDNFDRFLLRIKETVESFALLTQVLTRLQPFCTPRLGGVALSLMSSGWCSRARNEQWGVSVLGLGFFFCASLGSRATQTRLCVSVRGRTFLGGGVVRGSQGQVGFGSAEVLTAPLAVCSAARFRSMEALIAHFRAVSEGGLLTPGLAFRVVESPKGLVGVFIVSAGGVQPTRVHLRTPVGHNMHALASMAVDTLLGDFVMTFCSFDIVLGEIDR